MATFAAISDIELFLQITIPAAKLAAATRALEDATAAIQNYCHQVLFEVADDEITLDVPAGRPKLFLPELPVTTVTTVVEDGEALAEDDEWKLGQWGILHRVGGYWAEGIQIVTVTYSHGYATIPEDLVAVCTRAASRAYQAGLLAEDGAGVPGVASKSLGDYSVSFVAPGPGEGTMGASAARMLLMSEEKRLDRYRYVEQ